MKITLQRAVAAVVISITAIVCIADVAALQHKDNISEGENSIPLPSADSPQGRQARGMIHVSRTKHKPVYPYLARHLVNTFDLAEKTGVGIDIGSGPGNFIIELCKRTEMYWINADINPHFFPYFFDLAKLHGVGGRVGAIQADVHNLPFRSAYADVIVSRSSYQFWKDKPRAFTEIYRVLKPGGVAYIGRGMSENVPLKIAKRICGDLNRNPEKKINEYKEILRAAGISRYKIHVPKPAGSEKATYHPWVEFRKPKHGNGR